MNNTFAAIIIGMGGIVSTCIASPTTKATELFAQCSRKEFHVDANPRMQILLGGLRVPFISSGHTVSLDDGELVDLEVLVFQSELIAKEGMNAFDEALKHLDDTQFYMRVIAFESLVRITNLRPEGPNSGRFIGVIETQRDWLDRAKHTWEKWKAEQAGAYNPLTRPEPDDQR